MPDQPPEPAESTPTEFMPPPAPPSAHPDDERFPPGTLIAERYRIAGQLGVGGMGEVYRATDLVLRQPVALKFLPEAVGAAQSVLERFLNEVRIARQISHPNVCRVYDLGVYQGLHYISMEYVDGEDLASLLRRIGRLPSDKALEFARRICAGLAAAHEKGVLHRDLKPANIMIVGGSLFTHDLFPLAGVRQLAAELLARIPISIALAIPLCLFLVALRSWFRRRWLAAAAFILVLGLPYLLSSDLPFLDGPFQVIGLLIVLVILVRFGLLAMVIANITENALIAVPLTLDFSAWHIGLSLFTLLAFAALAALAFRLALAGRPLFPSD